ncbi:ABC transporter substrate-binding protein [Marinithermus hydrothermalis]|uniref:ABC-type transporter, periplasmic subunit n=1 Tax=Marinithermus hydrothermalis (strain DSM 14884 / JCM 11576 / T1) TaxID=869210 RepID=F2NNH8_MARHT|nr:ABC transporter substrate-binding protein [Marinithermus hydrothermalis]AEB10788.1 ABC-type transporter, periplasmic subunit [Marinithermus hydrothermalis DSM 14884]
MKQASVKRFLTPLAVAGLALGGAFAASDSDTFVHLTFGNVDTLDPAQAYDTASGYILENIYETLYTYKKGSLTEYEPLLATSYEVSEDGKTYTYTLRKGVKFHSGNEFTCRDVEYSIERLLVTNPADSAGWFYAESLLGVSGNAKDVLGEDASDAEYDAFWEKIDNAVECLDDYTVQFNLVAPDPAFFAKMMYTAASIVDSKWAIEHGAWSGTKADWRDWIGVDLRQFDLHTAASGTGAYRLVKWDGKDVVAERFEDYWGEKPQIKNVLVSVVDEESARIEALRQGDADRITVNDRAVLETQIRGIPGVKVWEDPAWAPAAATAVQFNFNISGQDNPLIGSGKLDGKGIPPDFFTDPDVRKGFAYAIDQDALVDELFLGKAVKLTMPLPPSFLGYDEELPIYNLDLDKAEEHLRKAWGGQVWEKGFELTIAYNTGNTIRQTVAEMIKANIEALNPKFKVNVVGLQWPDFLSKSRDKQLPIAILGWGADYADPDNFIYTFFHTNGFFASRNSFSNPEMDALVEEARTTIDPEKRAELYSRIGQLGYELVPYVTIPVPSPFIVTRDNIEGVYYNPMYSGRFLWKHIVKK